MKRVKRRIQRKRREGKNRRWNKGEREEEEEEEEEERNSKEESSLFASLLTPSERIREMSGDNREGREE